jgi:hypothetical protein
MIYATGAVYEGEWHQGLKHGVGKMVYANGDVYDGQWEGGNMSGRARYTHSNGTAFEGVFKNNMKNGRGRCMYRESGSFSSQAKSYCWGAGDVFDGEYLDNVRHGDCCYTWANGETLTCEWVHGSCPEWEAKNSEIKANLEQQLQRCKQPAIDGAQPAKERDCGQEQAVQEHDGEVDAKQCVEPKAELLQAGLADSSQV